MYLLKSSLQSSSPTCIHSYVSMTAWQVYCHVRGIGTFFKTSLLDTVPPIYFPENMVSTFFNMTGVQQTQIVFNNISIISSKFFFLALHICQRQSLSKFFLKIHRVSKVRFMRFYYLNTDFIRILLIKPHKSNFWYPMYFELKLR